MVHCPDSCTHSVSAVGRVTLSVPWGCVSGVVASMQYAAPRWLDAGGCLHRWYTKPLWDTRYVPGSSIDQFLSCSVPLTYSIPHGEEVFLCLYHRIALSIARLLIVQKLPGPTMRAWRSGSHPMSSTTSICRTTMASATRGHACRTRMCASTAIVIMAIALASVA